MKIINSVVIKLWLTIILIVTTVLIILSVALVSFFNSYFISETGQSLYQSATKVEEVLMSHHNQEDALDYAKELIEEPAGLIIIKNKNQLHSTYDDELKQIMVDEIRDNKDYEAVFKKNKHVTKTITVNYLNKKHRYILLGFPSQAFKEQGAIILFQDINSIEDTFQYVSIIILVVALLLILLTTVFAFFLSTRITKPLIELKKAAFQVAKGERSAKIETFSRDEIGELAIAFKKMERDIDQNISAIKMERNLRDKLIDAMADGVLSYHIQLEEQLINPVALKFLSVLSEEDKNNLKDMFENVIQTKEVHVMEINTKRYFYVVIITPVNDAGRDGETGAVALIRNMTEEKKNDEMKKRFIADVSHELRTPIQMLQGYTEALLDGMAESKEERDELLNIILDESMRLNRMVNELLNIAKYDAGEAALQKEQVNINDLFERIRVNFSQTMEENKIDFKVNGINKDVMMDYDKMIQVLTNLIDNAVRYTHPGDEILLSASSDDTLIIELSDTGVGIDEENLPHIFDRFYKVDEARTRGKHGTGLGLFIVRSIIESHDGEINVRSTKGKGTSFIINMPLH